MAYSSIGHIRLVFVGSLRIRRAGLHGIILLIITHGLCSAGLFFLANVLYDFRGSRSFIVNVGVLRVLPRLRFWLFVGACLNIAGPSLCLVSELILGKSLFIFSWVCLLPFALIRFFVCAHRIFLYGDVVYGRPS